MAIVNRTEWSTRGLLILHVRSPHHLPMPPDTSTSPASPSAHTAHPELDPALLSLLRQAASRPAGLADDQARAALSTLITTYQDRLYAICLRMVAGNRETASDLTQDTFLKVIQNLSSYDGRSKLSTWIIRIGMNACLSHLRSTRVRRSTSLSQGNPEDSTAPFVPQAAQTREHSPHSSVQTLDDRRLLATALASIDPEQRGVLILRDIQGLDYEHIADVLDVPVGTVKSRLFRARLALRDALDHRPPTST